MLTYGETDLGTIPAGGSRMPASAETLADGMHYIHLDGRRISEIVREMVPGHLREFLAEAGVAPEEITHVVPHQGNARMLESLKPLLGVDDAELHATAEIYGNTGSASIPVTLAESVRAGRVRPGRPCCWSPSAPESRSPSYCCAGEFIRRGKEMTEVDVDAYLERIGATRPGNSTTRPCATYRNGTS
ncbi:3-oxoacyl-[acyl-carrier-protein] synthase III C-terminal domain-containing protein [Streptomyces sp. M19]